MSWVEKLEWTQNDYGIDLEGKIYDSKGAVVDLTGATLKLIVYEIGSTAKIEAEATITSEPLGEWKYTVLDGDFDAGKKTYNVEIEISYGTPITKVVTASGASIHVRPEATEAPPP